MLVPDPDGTLVCVPAWLLMSVAILLAGAGGVRALRHLSENRRQR